MMTSPEIYEGSRRIRYFFYTCRQITTTLTFDLSCISYTDHQSRKNLFEKGCHECTHHNSLICNLCITLNLSTDVILLKNRAVIRKNEKRRVFFLGTQYSMPDVLGSELFNYYMHKLLF